MKFLRNLRQHFRGKNQGYASDIHLFITPFPIKENRQSRRSKK